MPVHMAKYIITLDGDGDGDGNCDTICTCQEVQWSFLCGILFESKES